MKYRALTKAIAHLVVCAGLIGGSFLAVPHVALQAMAQTKPTQGTQHVAQADGNAPTMVILDASGSMLAQDVDGKTRMAAAKEALTGFLNDVPDNAPLGLMTYGTKTGSSDAEKAAGCKDVTLLSAPGQRTAKSLVGDIQGITPRGYTPIGLSIQQAVQQLPKQGPKSVVLVSDGIETCAPPPVCDIAYELKREHPNLLIHTVGFKVDDAARTELSCVAQATGGTYTDADSAEALRSTLTTVTLRTGQGYQLPAKRVKASANSDDKVPTVNAGPVGHPTRVTVETPAEIKDEIAAEDYYVKIRVPEGHQLHVAYTAKHQVGSGGLLPGGIEVDTKVQDSKSHQCTAYVKHIDSNNHMNIPRSGEIIVNRNSGCTGEEYLLDFSVERNFGFKSPVEFDTTIVAVPQLSDVGDPANKAQSPVRKDTDLAAVPAVGQQLVTPGTEPDSAPNVPPTFRSEIVIGETQYVKIPAGWGQNLNFELSVVDEGRVDDQLFEDAVKEFEFALLNPARESVDLIGATTSDVTDVNKPVRFGTARAVSFANADQPNPAWLAGDHYLAVTLARNIGDNTDEKTLSVPVSYQIAFAPVGVAVAGPIFPDFKLPEESVSTSTTSASSAPSNAAANADVSSTSATTRLAIGVAVVGIVVLLAAVLVVTTVIRRRR